MIKWLWNKVQTLYLNYSSLLSFGQHNLYFEKSTFAICLGVQVCILIFIHIFTLLMQFWIVQYAILSMSFRFIEMDGENAQTNGFSVWGEWNYYSGWYKHTLFNQRNQYHADPPTCWLYQFNLWPICVVVSNGCPIYCFHFIISFISKKNWKKTTFITINLTKLGVWNYNDDLNAMYFSTCATRFSMWKKERLMPISAEAF